MFKKAMDQLSKIDKYFRFKKIEIDEKWEIRSFCQWWDNPSGGMQISDTKCLTRHHTVVVFNLNCAYVFFNGNFAYKVQNDETFLDDLKRCNLKGRVDAKSSYLIK